ncbi:MAG: tetratricopeptide repeat protein [Planctomycetia bacterium]|nr:tetratricopeptide repeat protein [Planctomycetia bacterium]
MLREAEGFLELELPRQALKCLDALGDFGTFRGQCSFLRGEALRQLGDCEEAIESLCDAADRSPSNVRVWTALAWCYKHSDRLPLAIAALEHARDSNPKAALVHYDLACYLSLAGDKRRALVSLGAAIDLDGHLRERVTAEADFDALRSDPDFQALLSATV